MFSLFRPLLYYARSRDGAVGRKTAKRTILRSRASETRRLLLPPFTAASELRVLLGASYETTLDLLGVRNFQKKFFWKDHEGREFETTNKREVLVPFPIAARAATRFGLEPQLVDVEPVVELQKFPIKPTRAIVAVVGHTDHGKTSLIDALAGTSARESEAGGITQTVRATRVGDFTFLDTPGHKALEISRGRAVGSADLALVVISAEISELSEISEILIQADRLGVPLVFAITKVDLCSGEVARRALVSLCRELHTSGAIYQDLTSLAKRSIFVSTKLPRTLPDLMHMLKAAVAQTTLPASLPPTTLTNSGSLAEIRAAIRSPGRRADWFTGILEQPSAVGVVLDVVNKADMLLALRVGNISLGDHFVCGSAYGKVRTLGLSPSRASEAAEGGEVVRVSGVFSGGFSADDVFYVFQSRERAFRLAAYRERIARLTRLQTAGPPLGLCGFEVSDSTQTRVHDGEEEGDERTNEGEEEEEEEDFEWTPGETPDLRRLRDKGDEGIFVAADSEEASEAPRPPVYEHRETWTEEAKTGTGRVLSRQAKRDLARMRAREIERGLLRKEAQVAENIRAEIHGRAKKILDSGEGDKTTGKPVVSVIVKVSSENLLSGLLDEFERLEEELESAVRIRVVHGGVGTLNSEDVDHGLAERQFGLCPLYALEVGVSDWASEKANNERIPIKKFRVFTEVVEDVRRRALTLKGRVEEIEYREELRRRAPRHVVTESGL